MKICVLSDSHGNKKRILELINNNNFDNIFFLGDGLKDVENINKKTLKKVCGNCDFFSDEAITRFEKIGNKKFMLTHGHDYKAKISIATMVDYAKQNYCDFLCYGHTHKQRFENINGLWVLNPGAFKNGNYAIIDIKENGETTVELK